jgi:phosphoribosyl 1,2-cyclic phosphate phosphodiesterase
MHGIQKVDAVLYTHHHFDHVAGMDDLRPFLFDNRVPIPCFAKPNSATVIKDMYRYIFTDGSYPGVPRLRLLDTVGEFSLVGRYDSSKHVVVKPIEVSHGNLQMFGYRIGKFGYVTDTNYISEESIAQLEGLDVLILDALRDEPHPMHFTIDEATQVAVRIGAKKTYFIHMTHTVKHSDTESRLPGGIYLGYDGLVIEVND